MKIVIKHILLLIVLSFYSRILSAQQTVSEQYAKFINIEDINAHISTLTSPGFEGREAGKRGGRKTEAFIKNTFEKIGLTPIIDSATNKTYFQKVPLLGGSHSYNVLGWVKGSVFPDEVLIITAHYDHLG
ncbi:MAG: hypothetical protein OEX22_12275, partial [Cyclobacteriaceae bacterium]|nr:hypothetical protein [Cyclobacteriaceae bacterium]